MSASETDLQVVVDDQSRIAAGAGTHLGLERPQLDQAPRVAAQHPVRVTFEQLYREHLDFTVRTLRHLGVPEQALLDAVQETWLVVHRQLSSFAGRSSHRTWLFSIAINIARHQRRWQERHQHRWTALPDDLPDKQPGPDRLHASREAFGLVQQFLTTLDEPRRLLFVSQLLEELNADETAQLLGIERTQIYHRVRDLRRAFKSWVVERSGDPE